MATQPYNDMRRYLDSVRALPEVRFTDDEAQALKEADDTDALFAGLAPLVPFIVQKYVGDAYRRENYQDLIQEGNIGVLTAINAWKPHKGMALSSWCYMYIRKAVIRDMRKEIAYSSQHMGFDFDRDTDGIDEKMISDHDGTDYSEYITDDGAWEDAQEAKARYRSVRKRLPDREKLMLDQLLEGQTQEWIAHYHSLSQSRVSRVLAGMYSTIRGLPEA